MSKKKTNGYLDTTTIGGPAAIPAAPIPPELAATPETSGPTCGVCRWFVQVENTLGSCRRHPPTSQAAGGRITDGRAQHLGLWPLVYACDWCGEFSSR